MVLIARNGLVFLFFITNKGKKKIAFVFQSVRDLLTLHEKDDHCSYVVGLFRGLAVIEQDDDKACHERHFLSRKPAVALVSGGFWHDRRVGFGHHLRVRAGHGKRHWHDLPADLPGLCAGLCGGGLCVATRLLSSESHHHLHLSATALGNSFV